MNWRIFNVTIVWGLTLLAAFLFIFFVSGFIALVFTPLTIWGAGISFIFALLGYAALCGMGAVK